MTNPQASPSDAQKQRRLEYLIETGKRVQAVREGLIAGPQLVPAVAAFAHRVEQSDVGP